MLLQPLVGHGAVSRFLGFLPVWLGMSGLIYCAIVVCLDAGFLWLALQMCRGYSDGLARRTFRYSIIYLTLLFAALFLDRLV